MQPSTSSAALAGVTWLVGDAQAVMAMPRVPALRPFDEAVLSYLDDASRALLRDPASRAFPDVVTFAFWARRASTEGLAARFAGRGGGLRLGRGTVFHVAPSNVPVNFAYSLAAGLLAGNACVVRVPSREFEQVGIVARALGSALGGHPVMRGRVALARYGHEREVNDALSSLCDARVVWGGDATVADLRRSPLPSRATEVTFADRCSVAVIDAGAYLAEPDRAAVARAFYNDTYLTDQNACTSPCVVAWTGEGAPRAREAFWAELHALVASRYDLQPVRAVSKLASADLAAVALEGARVEPALDNLVTRVSVPEVDARLFDLRDSCGLFFEVEIADVSELRPLLDDPRCQTVGYLGDPAPLRELVAGGLRGVDRVVPVGKTMDFDLLWDGYDLVSALTRTVVVL